MQALIPNGTAMCITFLVAYGKVALVDRNLILNQFLSEIFLEHRQ